jgi:hypothetical protein
VLREWMYQRVSICIIGEGGLWISRGEWRKAALKVRRSEKFWEGVIGHLQGMGAGALRSNVTCERAASPQSEERARAASPQCKTPRRWKG